MKEFVAETGAPQCLRAWINPEDPNDNVADPQAPRPDGWRVVIEREGEAEPVRATWEQTLAEALAHVHLVWPERPVWRDYATEKIVSLEQRNGECFPP